MGLLTKTEFREELYSLLDNAQEVAPQSLGGDATTQALCDRYLQFAYARVWLPSTFEHVEAQTTQTITLVTSTASYTLTVWAIDHVRYENGGKTLPPMTRVQLSQRGTTILGPPARFARWGTLLYPDRVPTSAENGHTLTVYGWRQPPTWGDTVSELRSEWDEVILEGAAWRGWVRLGDLPRADIHRENYAALVNDNRTVLSVEARQEGWSGGPIMPTYMARSVG